MSKPFRKAKMSLSFDEGSIQQIRYEDTESDQITKMFIDNREYMLKTLLAEE